MLTVLKKLGWFFKREWKRYTLAIGLLFFAGLVDLLPPWLIGVVIDGIQQGQFSSKQFQWMIIGWIAVTLVAYVINYVWHYLLFGGAFVLERILRTNLMAHFMRMKPSFYERNRTGDLMARATNDLGAVSNTAGFGILTLFDSTIFMICIIAVMSTMISWKLTLAALLPLPFIALLLSIFGKQIHKRFMAAQDAFGELNDDVLESISGVRVIRAFVQEKASEKKFRAKTEEVLAKNLAVVRIDALFEPGIKVIVGISYLIGIGYGAYLVFHSELTLGQLITFNMFLGMLIWPMIAMGELINIMQRGNASLDRVNETLSSEADVQNKADTAKQHQPSQIAFESYSFQYPSSPNPNLSKLKFAIRQGQTLGIVGKTGSGKTTILKQLLREYPLGEGMLRLGEHRIDELKLEDALGYVGYVPQQPFLFSRSIRDNILFGKSEATEEQLQQALERASFAKDIQFLPDGLETMVGERGVALSGGQKQRVSIARALIADPEILLLDDALSAVDAKTEMEIISGIKNERQNKTTIITTHRLSAVQHADWIVVLEDGVIIEEGTHEQLLQQNGWYKEQYDRQQIEMELSS
ncbi:ABC transporter ATP-binding protein [Paenibacillus septentrionalis]|uniref:ABC transporter ATP-binding protein n=1 Tax=Paenibacillus septentrionalis TaxID=429342 RepID=A0ABW1V5S0_9BACL